MASEEKEGGSYIDSEAARMMRIVDDHKVFWTTLPIELAKEGRPLKIGMSVALVGTDEEDKIPGGDSEEPTAFDKLNALARWLTSGDRPGVRFEIRRHDNIVFYLPDDMKTNRKEYVVVIRILHSDQFDLPLNEKQLKTVKEIETRLKELGCPKDQWKKRPA